MKQVININFQGRVVPIEVTAFEMLKKYTESLNRHFANEEGKEEIINDIESRIGELFQERLAKGATCITDDDVNAIINSMGRPEDFETSGDSGAAASANTTGSEQQEEQQQSYQHANAAGRPKRLYRDENNKILGGVCAGIANYFGIDSLIVRILFVVTGVGFFVYILLWIFLPNSTDVEIGSTRKKLYRDSDDKIVAGVCSGIGNYFGINSWIPRILFLVPFLGFVSNWGGHWGWGFPDFIRVGFSPTALIIYIILWLVIPEALTTSEKLEMKGEKVDMNSIKNSVMEEMKGVGQRAKKFGEEAAAFTTEKGKAMTAEVNKAARRTRTSLGDIIALLFKVFGYFIIGSVGFAVVCGLFALAVAAIGLFPLKDYLITDGWQNLYAWGTFLFFIAAPLIGIITWLIRRLAKVRTGSKMIRLSFISIWIVGWVCMILFVSSIFRDFKYTNDNIAEEEVTLVNPKVSKLELTSQTPLQRYTRSRWFRLEPFSGLDEDTAYVKNFDIQIFKSTSDSFRVTMVRMADGRTRSIARENTAKIRFGMQQKDTILQADQGIAINRNDKFRNQRVIIRIYVPAGKQVMIRRDMGWGHNIRINAPFNDNDWNWDYNDYDQEWESDVLYTMKADGKLYDQQGRTVRQARERREDEWDGNTRVRIDENGIEVKTESRGGEYRYEDRNKPATPPVAPTAPSVDSIKIKQEKQRKEDSIKKVIEKSSEELKKLEKAVAGMENDNLMVYKLPVVDPMATFN